MAKQLIYKEEARQALERGINLLAKAVKASFGPKGRNVVLEKKWGSPTITNDGVTIAKEIDLKDPCENAGAQLLKEVAEKTSDIAGDGTTTAVVLAQAIFKQGMKNITAGANPMILKRGIEKAVDTIAFELKKIAQKVEKKDEMVQVASISAHNDKKVGELIADAMEKVGKEGVITVEEGEKLETQLDVVEGMQFDRGYLSPYFINDPENMEVLLNDPYILIHESKISSVQDLVPLLEKIGNAKKPLFIIAEDIEGEALAVLVVNKLKGVIQCCAVKAPGYGDKRKAMMEDIAVLTGGEFVSGDLGVKLESVDIKNLGGAKSVRIDKDNTTIIEGKGNLEDIKSRIERIRKEIKDTKSDYDKEKLEERLAKLAGGVAVIRVGAATEIEMKSKKALIEDALHATRAAVEEGIVPGGGVALLRCIPALEKLVLKGDEAIGLNIIKRALEEPIRQIAVNAGFDGSVIVNKIKNSKANEGFDAEKGEFVDMIKAGIIDPVKVTHSALRNAASISSLILTTETLITEKVKEEEEDKKK